MKNIRLKQIIVITIIITSFTCLPGYFLGNGNSNTPFFTLSALTIANGKRPDYLNLIQQQLERIGIGLNIQLYDWWSSNPILFYDYDMLYTAFSNCSPNPDYTGVYNENGSLNVFRYHTDIDYNETLGTGINEWYMREGLQIMPSNGQERIAHYWAWEQYLMDKICPMLPFFAPKSYSAYWEPLEGYNFTEGVLRSWGKMNWINSHEGQLNINEIVISDDAWSDLNPLFQDDSASDFISSTTMDTLVVYNSDLTVYPHLAQNFTLLNDTHLRITTRDGIKWQPDYEGNFTNEYFDANDVYFTFYSWMKVSNEVWNWDWIEDMVLVDNRTVDIYIDGDPSTPENDPYHEYLIHLSTRILPEHYLNQTQLADGVTPDITSPNWNTFATNCFGTGLFEITSFSTGDETVLTVFPDCWYFNQSITNDPTLNWEQRFGTFSSTLNQLRVRIFPKHTMAIEEFKLGKIDIESVTSYPYFQSELEQNTKFGMQADIMWYLGFLGFNLAPAREITGNLEPCENDTSLTKGLAVRKAICYTINRNEINNIVHSGEYQIINYPIIQKLGVWCNPNIIKYDHNLEIAKYYMALAGYDVPEHSYDQHFPTENFLWVYILAGVSYAIGIGVLISRWIFIRRKKTNGAN